MATFAWQSDLATALAEQSKDFDKRMIGNQMMLAEMLKVPVKEPEVIIKEQPQIFVVKQSNTILIVAGAALLGLLIWKGKLLK